MKIAAAIVAAIVVAAPQAAAKGPQPPRSVFGIVWDGNQTSLVQLNALTLRPETKAVKLGTAAWYLGRSPGAGMRAAFRVGLKSPGIRFVDLGAMRSEARVELPCAVATDVVWEDASRLVAACFGPASSILVVDPVTRRVVTRTALKGQLVGIRSGRGFLVGVLAPIDGIGAARLVVADGLGAVRSVALPGIRAGTEVLDGGTYHARLETPALAVDPSGVKAAVVTARGDVTTVDLQTLSVNAHAPVVRAPAAVRKLIEGTQRHAVWTTSNTIAVSGTNYLADTDHHSLAAGLTVIDAAEWTSRVIDRNASAVTYSGPAGMLLSYGAIWDQKAQKSIGDGLIGYDATGSERFHLFRGEAISIAGLAGTYVYVRDGNLPRYRIVDTERGSVIKTVSTQHSLAIFPTRSVY